MLLHAGLLLVLLTLRRQVLAIEQFFSDNTLQSFALSGLVTQLLLVLLPSVVILIVYRIPPYDIVGGKAKAGSLVIGLTVGIPAAVVFQGMNNLFIYVLIRSGIQLPQPTLTIPLIQGPIYRLAWPALLVLLFTMVLLPGLIEELMFRGVLQASLRSGGAIAAAVIWQALTFSLFHRDPLFILPPLMAGLLLGFIRLQSESLLPAMLAHMSLNLSLLAINPLLPRLTAQYIAGSATQATSLLYASLIASFIAAVTFIPLLVLLAHQKRSDQAVTPKTSRHFAFEWRLVLALIVMATLMYAEFR